MMSKFKGPRKLEGKPIHDATEPVSLAIRTSDIRHGLSTAPDACAAAIACVRQFEALGARVHANRTYIEYDGFWLRYRNTPSLHTEIMAFDRGEKFHPGIYTLAVLQPTKRANGRRQGGKTKGTGKRTGQNKPKAKVRTMRNYPHFSQQVPPSPLAALHSGVIQEKK